MGKRRSPPVRLAVLFASLDTRAGAVRAYTMLWKELRGGRDHTIQRNQVTRGRREDAGQQRLAATIVKLVELAAMTVLIFLNTNTVITDTLRDGICLELCA